jgi:hypothetical protein
MNRDRRLINFIFYLFVCLFLANHALLYFLINLDFVDSDQPIMWLAAKDFSEGNFYVPRYYGQNYNTMLEALLAVPFLKLGVSVYKAVPIVTHCLAVFPYLFVASFLYKKEKKLQALVCLGFVLCLTTGYYIMNSLPRGFVTGLVFAPFLIISFNSPKNYNWLFINFFLCYLAYLINQNTVLVTVPSIMFFWLKNYKDPIFYSIGFLGLMACLPFDYLLNHFYKIHPGYIVHGGEQYFSFQLFKDAISNLNIYFANISPFADGQSVTLLLFLSFFLLILLYRNINLFFTIFFGMFIVGVALSYSKIHDGVNWSFYSLSRMYLALPLLICLVLSQLKFRVNFIFYIFVLVVIGFNFFKFFNVRKDIVYHTNEKKRFALQVSSIVQIKKMVNLYWNMAKEHKVKDIICVENFWHQDFLIYAGPALYGEFPKTFNPHYDRRHWRFEEEDISVKNSFLILSGKRDYFRDTQINIPKNQFKKLDDYGLILVSNNTYTTIDFLRRCRLNVIQF